MALSDPTKVGQGARPSLAPATGQHGLRARAGSRGSSASSHAAPRTALALVVASLTLACAAPALAQDTMPIASRRAAAAREGDRPYTLAEVDVGFLTLPIASLCTTSFAECLTGDASFALGIRSFYRTRGFAIGAGIDWATSLVSEPAKGPPEVGRQHERRYFLVETMFRWYALRATNVEAYIGAQAGLVVINDSWSTLADREPYSDADFIGPRAATLGTQGASFGAQAGVDWVFMRNASVGIFVRSSNFILPDERLRSPTGDTASLAGRVDVLHLGLAASYRIAL